MWDSSSITYMSEGPGKKRTNFVQSSQNLNHSITRPTEKKTLCLGLLISRTVCPEHANKFDCKVTKQGGRAHLQYAFNYSHQTWHTCLATWPDVKQALISFETLEGFWKQEVRQHLNYSLTYCQQIWYVYSWEQVLMGQLSSALPLSLRGGARKCLNP